MKNFLKKHKNTIIELLIVVLIAIYSFSLAPKTFQNDTFYTVPIGKLIRENGIDFKDHYSWHEDLPYTYPHWLYDVIMSLIYDLGSWKAIYISVCILSILLGITIYKVNKKLVKNQIVSFFIAILSMLLLKDYITARAQLVTFILFMIYIYLIEKFLENPKKIYYAIGIILTSLLMVNLHVAVWLFIFVLALPYIAEYIISLVSDVIIYKKINILFKRILLKFSKNKEKIKKDIEKIYISNEKIKNVRENEEPYKLRINKNKNVKWLILVMLICVLTGFLTPLGTTPFTYLYKTIQGSSVDNINEHLPLTLIKNIPIMCTIVVVLAVVTFTKVKIRLSDLFMIGGLTYLMFSSKRQATMFVLIGSIILNRLICEAIREYKLKDFIKEILKNGIVTVGIIIIMIYSIQNIQDKKDSVYIDEKSYPVKAADWMLENLDVKNIKLFNEYNYGSYLLYRGIPVFIDSRADLYTPEFNNGNDIFMDFINTSNIGKYYGSTFEKYGITHIILYKNSKISMLIDDTQPKDYNKIYTDDNFVIYEIIKK